MRHDPTFWILARASGIVAFTLLTATLVAGLTLKTRPIRALRPASVTDVHRFLSLMALCAVGVHGIALVLDETVEIPLAGLLVPGLSEYRPLWVGVGVATAEVMALIHVSFRLRRRIGVPAWRRMHRLAYVAFAGATVHGLASGTDSDHPWMFALYLAASGIVAAATAWRVSAPRGAATKRPADARPEPSRSAS